MLVTRTRTEKEIKMFQRNERCFKLVIEVRKNMPDSKNMARVCDNIIFCAKAALFILSLLKVNKKRVKQARFVDSRCNKKC